MSCPVCGEYRHSCCCQPLIYYLKRDLTDVLSTTEYEREDERWVRIGGRLHIGYRTFDEAFSVAEGCLASRLDRAQRTYEKYDRLRAKLLRATRRRRIGDLDDGRATDEG